MSTLSGMRVVELGTGDVGRNGVTKRDVGRFTIVMCGCLLGRYKSYERATAHVREVERLHAAYLQSLKKEPQYV